MKFYEIKLQPYDFNVEKEVEKLLKEGFSIEQSIRYLISELETKTEKLVSKKDEFHQDLEAYQQAEKGSDSYNKYFKKYDEIHFEDLTRSIYRTDAFIDNQIADIKTDIGDLHAYYGTYLLRKVTKTVSDLKKLKQEDIELLEEEVQDIKENVGEYIITYNIIEKMKKVDYANDTDIYSEYPEMKDYKNYINNSLFVSKEQAYQVWLKCIQTLTRIKRILNPENQNINKEILEK